MLNKVRETLKLLGVETGDTILVACSGGPDSVALLLALRQLDKQGFNLRLSVAHFDHCLRGEESRHEANFVKELAHAFGIPFYLSRGDVAGYARSQKLTIQEAARELRYAFFREVREKTAIKWIATAHTLDDQAEEVLLRLVRGTSLSGLAGIPMKTNDFIIRPFLNIEKRQILDFLRELGQTYCEDSSNLATKYTRNKIRHNVIPLLKEINPSFLKAISRTTQILSDDDACLEAIANEALQRSIIWQDEKLIELSMQKVDQYHCSILRRMVKSAINQIEPKILRSLRLDHIDAILNLIKSGKTSQEVVLPQGIIVRRIYDRLSFKKTHKGARSSADNGSNGKRLNKVVSPPCRLNLSKHMGTLTITYKSISLSRLKGKRPPKKLYIDADALHYPLTVRCRLDGERFWPLGAPRPYKLKEFLIARKIPRHVRRYIPLIISDDQVVAVAGIEVSEPFKITTKTKKVVEISWEPSKELKRELSLVNINDRNGN